MSQMKMAWSQEKATSNANLIAVKERMKEMAEEQKAMAADLIEFMELSLPQLSLLSRIPTRMLLLLLLLLLILRTTQGAAGIAVINSHLF
jgi:hypothetical protein